MRSGRLSLSCLVIGAESFQQGVPLGLGEHRRVDTAPFEDRHPHEVQGLQQFPHALAPKVRRHDVILEEYLLEFKGSLVVVTHDRHFLDRIADHLLVFTGGGAVKDFIGGYTEYRTFMKDLEASKKPAAKEEPRERVRTEAPRKRRLSYKEQQELSALERDMEALNAEKAELEAFLSSGSGDYDAIRRASERYSQIKEELDGKELRWLELSV